MAHPIEVFTAAELKTIVLIGDYLLKYGRYRFTYDDIDFYHKKSRAYRSVNIRTVFRNIRRFCNYPYELLEREKRDDRVYFKPTDKFWIVYEWLKSQLRSRWQEVMTPVKAFVYGLIIFALAYAYVVACAWALALGAQDNIMAVSGFAVLVLSIVILFLLVLAVWKAVQESRPKYVKYETYW